MYSKKSGRGSLPPRMPEHYSGWAFQPPSPPKDRPPRVEEKPENRPAPPPPPKQEIHESYPRPLPFLPPPPVPEPPRGEKPIPPSFLPAQLEQLLGKSGFLRSLNLDFEELLLIGLIVLLGSSGGDNELPLLLALLLLC